MVEDESGAIRDAGRPFIHPRLGVASLPGRPAIPDIERLTDALDAISGHRPTPERVRQFIAEVWPSSGRDRWKP